MLILTRTPGQTIQIGELATIELVAETSGKLALHLDIQGRQCVYPAFKDLTITEIANVVVRVLGIKGRQARLGIDAPPEIHITRPEMKNRSPRPRVES